jgi:hypothetical protein
VVAVTGQILPSGGLIVLKTVGVVGGVVPDDQIVSDDIGLLGGGNRDAEGCEASQDKSHGNQHGECLLKVVHWSILPFKNLVMLRRLVRRHIKPLMPSDVVCAKLMRIFIIHDSIK